MNDTIVKYIMFGVLTLMTVGVISYALLAKNEASTLSNKVNEQFGRYAGELENSEFLKYDKTELYGSDIRNCIKEYLGGYALGEKASLYIQVITSMTNNKYENGGYLDEIKNFTDSKYIDPRVLFKSELIIDKNQVIMGIKFTQK